MKEELIFASKDQGKLKRMEQYFSEMEIPVHCLTASFREVEIDDIFVIAAEKVLQIYDKIHRPCMVLDTGFYVENHPLRKNFPGAFIKRDLLEPYGVDGLLEQMKDVTNRSCCFRECLAYFDGEDLKKFEGIRYGQLSYEKRGESTQEAWSSLWSIFIPQNCDKTLAEMTEEERRSKQEGHVEAVEEFVKWYKTKNKGKVLQKIS